MRDAEHVANMLASTALALSALPTIHTSRAVPGVAGLHMLPLRWVGQRVNNGRD
jgi:hypothetical protein